MVGSSRFLVFTDWLPHRQVVVKGTFIVAQAVLPLASQNAVNICIGTGISAMVLPTSSSYSISKMSQARIFDYIHLEYPHIRTHTIHPGNIETRMADIVRANGLELMWDDSKYILTMSFSPCNDTKSLYLSEYTGC